MHTEVQNCINKKDIKGLRYIFIDCLDVDPTFEKYKEDNIVCKNQMGFFEPYKELSMLTLDTTKWNMQYWERLKLDLEKNFSAKRFEHMINVAKVVYAEKIRRLQRERSVMQSKTESNTPMLKKQEQEIASSTAHSDVKKLSGKEQQEKMLEERRRQIEENNKQIAKKEQEQKKRLEEQKKKYSATNTETNRSVKTSVTSKEKPKKDLGIVLIMLAVAIIVFIMVIR